MLNLRNELFWHIDRYETGNDRWQSSQWLAIWNSCHGRSSGMRTQWLLALIRMDTGNVSTRQSQKKQKQSVIIHPSPDILCFYFPISFLNQAQTFYWNKCARKSPPPRGQMFCFLLLCMWRGRYWQNTNMSVCWLRGCLLMKEPIFFQRAPQFLKSV